MGSCTPYRTDDAETVLVALGSVLGALAEVVDELRDEGERGGCPRRHVLPPLARRRGAAARCAAPRAVIVLERAFAVGRGSILGQDVRLSLRALATTVHDVVVGLGGRPVTRSRRSRGWSHDVRAGRLARGALHFLDLDQATRRCRASSADAPDGGGDR